MEHTTPSEAIFNELKDAARKIWNTYDNTYGYVDEKVGRINSIRNYADNAMICWRMFDSNNKRKMRDLLSDEAIQYVEENE